MPQIFDDEGRERVRSLLIENGFKSIKAYGLKKTSIAEVAARSGIATGTFYNFFKNKEEFVYQIMLYKREESKRKLDELTKKGKIDRAGFKAFLESIFFEDNNIFKYIDEREIAQLRARWPEEYWKNNSNDSSTLTHVIGNLKNPRKDLDLKVLANLMKSMVLIDHGREQLYEEVCPESMDIFIDAIVRYVFGK